MTNCINEIFVTIFEILKRSDHKTKTRFPKMLSKTTILLLIYSAFSLLPMDKFGKVKDAFLRNLLK